MSKQIDHIVEPHKSYYEEKKRNNVPTDNEGTLQKCPQMDENLILYSKISQKVKC